MNENVLKVLNEQLWNVATCGADGPNVIPVGFKTVTEDGRLIIANVAMVVTADNIKNGSRIAIAATDAPNNLAFGIKGTAEYEEAGETVDMLNRIAEEKGFPFRARGAIIVTPTHVFSTLPGPDNGKDIDWRV